MSFTEDSLHDDLLFLFVNLEIIAAHKVDFIFAQCISEKQVT